MSSHIDLPEEDPALELGPLADLLRGRGIVALTGASCSTESGIPDYRGPGTRRRARDPIQALPALAQALSAEPSPDTS